MDEGEQNRSEQPTPYKLDRARRKGSVARGTDLGFLTGLAAFLGFVWISGPALMAALQQAMREALVSGGQIADDPHAVVAATALIASRIWPSVGLAIGSILGVVLLFEVFQTGLVFSSEPLKPDLGRLSPARGLKRLFTLRLLLELAKNILKLAIYAVIAWLVIRGALHQAARSVGDARSLASGMMHAAIRMLLAFAAAALAFAAVDQIINRRDFLKRMRMSRREVRREVREREGEPRLRQKRKQMHAEFVRMSRSLRAIRDADVLVVNPQHIAVALRYDRRTMSSPTVTTLGTGQFALRLKRLAFLYNVPVVEDRALARELIRKSGIGRQVPETSFQAIADIYNRLKLVRNIGTGR